MRAGLRSLVLCLTCCALLLVVAIAAVAPGLTFGEGVSSGLFSSGTSGASGASGMSSSGASPGEGGGAVGGGSGGSSALGGSLVIAESPTEGEQVLAQRRAKLANPEAIAARRVSRTKFEHLDTAQALHVARDAFPGVVNEPAGGAPKLPAGETVVKYEAKNAAAIALPGGKHGVIESLGPIATPAGHGRFTPIDLALHSTGSGYAPANSNVAVDIPKHASSGVSMPGDGGDGVSLTPVNAQGQPLGGSEGVQEGASVVYANTQTDTDTLAKPTTGGFELDSLLRSVDSPTTLYYKVGMPAGAKLVSEKGPGGARVALGGKTIAWIAPVSAQDAEGTSVPVHMSIAGSALGVAVERGSGEYDYPIEVDPHVYDETLGLPSENENNTETNWRFHYEEGSFKEAPEGEGAWMYSVGNIVEKEHDEFRYGAHGQASVTYIAEESEAALYYSRLKLEFVHGSPEEEYTLAGPWEGYSKTEKNFCDIPVEEEGTLRCGAHNEGNEVRIMQTATQSAPESDGFFFWLYKATVGVLQKEGPKVEFNTSEATIDTGRQNVLYGGGGWLGQYNGAVEVTAKDPGLGISDVKVKDLTAGPHGEHWQYNDPVYADHLCTGVWCSQTFETETDPHGMYFTYNPEMAEGANTFEVCVEDKADMSVCDKATVNVDSTPPYGIKIASGLEEKGTELSATQHQVTVEASDELSGIKSIAVTVDGREVGSPSGSCSGKCTASRTVTLEGEKLGAGEHKLIVTAYDYADNEAQPKEYTFAIRNATPVKLGPGTVDPVTGQFALHASDVDIAGVPSVSRAYLSRSASGPEGPLGRQWSLAVGTAQNLRVLPDGSVELWSSGGSATIFEEENGKFIAPSGDGNLTLEAKEKEAGKGITEYLLRDPTAGTTTTFTLPSGSETWRPTATEGAAPDSKVSYSYTTLRTGWGNMMTGPSEVLGPVPVGVSCGSNPAEVKLEELKPGCRALIFTYADKTTAGEKEGEWKEFAGQLAKVSLVAYNPAKGVEKMETKVVAEYAYDKQGRLRAEWNPQIESSTACGKTCSALKTTYGYDAEGHVTALTPAGQQPWAFTYGTIAGDSNAGRLLKVTRAQPKSGASEEEVKKTLGEQKEAPTNTAEPKISGVPVVGIRMAVSQGTWSGRPIVYSYQWERCGTLCESILGATNANFTPVTEDINYALRVKVSAINGGGSTTTTTLISGQVHMSSTEKTEGELHSPEPGSTVEYKVPMSAAGGGPYIMSSTETAKWGQKKDVPVEATAIFPPDEPQGWPAADYKRASIGYLDIHAREVDAASPSGGIAVTEYNSLNEVTRTLSAADRAIALKETCESEKACKSAEVAEKLSSENKYNGETQAEKEQEEKEVSEKKKPAVEPGRRLLETAGPEHKVRLASGTEEETRDHQKFSYNEEAPKEEEHNLPTKVLEWIEVPISKKVINEHEKHLYYNGQNNLGWKLRKPTLVSSTVEGHTSTTTTSYEQATGNPLETTSSVSIGAPVYMTQFGSHGKGAGQFEIPTWTALDGSGNLWVSDTENSRVEEFTATGTFVKAIGWGVSNGKAEFQICTSGCQAGISGSGSGQFACPEGIAISSTNGNVYVTDCIDSRVDEFKANGEFVRAFGELGNNEGQLNTPMGIAITPSGGEVWVSDGHNKRIVRFSETGSFKGSFGSSGQGDGEFENPGGIAFLDGHAYVVDGGNGDDRVEEFTMSGEYVAQFGSKGTGQGQFVYPRGIVANPASGDLYVADEENDRVQEFTAGGTFVTAFGTKGSGNGELHDPEDLAVTPAGYIYVVDSLNNRIEEWEPKTATPIYTSQFGEKGTGNGQLKEPRAVAVTKNANVDVLDGANSRMEEFSPTGTYLNKFGAYGSEKGDVSGPSAMTVDSKGNVWVADTGNNRIDEFNEKREWVQAFGWGVYKGESKLEVCTTTCKAGTAGSGSGEFKELKAIAVNASGDVYVADSGNNRVQEFTEKGEFLAAFGFKVDESGKEEFEICTATKCKAGTAGTGNGQFKEPRGIAIAPNGSVWVADTGNDRVQEFGQKNEYLTKFGSVGTGNVQFKEPKGIAIDAAGNVWVTDGQNDRVQELTQSGAFVTGFGDVGTGNGQFEEPWGIAFGASGDVYVADIKNNRVQQWTTAPNPSNAGAKDTKITYYTAATNAEYPGCGGHPEWASLICQTEPEVQPGDSGPPSLPVTTITYNMWEEPETIVETFPKSATFGEHTRTTKKKYDPAGREEGSEETAVSLKEGKEEEDKEDKALPAVADEYNAETGALVKLTSTIEGKAKAITSVFNTLGQLTSYTDAEGSTTKYAYDIDGRVEEVTEPKGKQIYAYDPTTGFLTKLQDSAAGMFTATYGVAGELLTVGYPNAMTAKYTYNTIGQATHLVYEKTAHCAATCPEIWFGDTDAFGPKGELAFQYSTLSTEVYEYNEEGQLTQTEETATEEEGCVKRAYGYSEETGERTSVTTRQPREAGACETEGGVVEGHFYDAVGRLIDPGVTYDALGNMTKVPALDAGGQAITSSFYVDNQVATQEQNEKSIAYTYDPAGRTMIAKTTTKSGSTTAISHYAGPGEALTWTCEEAGECKEEKETKWTRNIPGIDGALDAIQTSSGTTELELHDLQGDIVATASLSETATGLLSTHNVTEFGVPVGTAPKYSWLGADGVESELGTGVLTEAGSTYVPQMARTLQTEQVIPPGAAPNGVMDTEAYCPPELGWANQSGNEAAANTVAEQRAMEQQLVFVIGGDPAPIEKNFDLDEVVSFENELQRIYDEGRTASPIELARVIVWEVYETLERGGLPEHGYKDIAEYYGADTIIEWGDTLVGQLNECRAAIEENGYGICHLSVETVALEEIATATTGGEPFLSLAVSGALFVGPIPKFNHYDYAMVDYCRGSECVYAGGP